MLYYNRDPKRDHNFDHHPCVGVDLELQVRQLRWRGMLNLDAGKAPWHDFNRDGCTFENANSQFAIERTLAILIMITSV